MNFNNWELLLLFWFAMEQGAAFAISGRPKLGKYSWFSSLVTYALLIWIMYNAGLFRG